MTESAQQADRPEEQGWALKKLLALHTSMRNDLTALRRAVAALAGDGQDVDGATAVIDDLSIQGGGVVVAELLPQFLLVRARASRCGGHRDVPDGAPVRGGPARDQGGR